MTSAQVRVYSLTRGEHHERSLAAIGLPPAWVGRAGAPPLRAAVLAAALARFRPHVVQAAHFYVNLHASIAGKLSGAAPIGTIRSDLRAEMVGAGRWGRMLLLMPPDLITNSWVGRQAAEAGGRDPATVHVIGNVIDLPEFDRRAGSAADLPGPAPVALAVANLMPAKRLDRFLRALALVRQQGGDLTGAVAGEGPERQRLEALARSLGLLPAGVRFLGERDDVPALLRAAAFVVLSSDHEGSPNAILEAMAAARPVITTPCGDAERMVGEDSTGYLVPFDDVGAMAERMRRLAGDPELRRRLGQGGRQSVERSHGRAALAGQLAAMYQAIAARCRRPRLAEALS